MSSWDPPETELPAIVPISTVQCHRSAADRHGDHRQASLQQRVRDLRDPPDPARYPWLRPRPGAPCTEGRRRNRLLVRCCLSDSAIWLAYAAAEDHDHRASRPLAAATGPARPGGPDRRAGRFGRALVRLGGPDRQQLPGLLPVGRPGYGQCVSRARRPGPERDAEITASPPMTGGGPALVASEQGTRQYPDGTVDGLSLTVPDGNPTGLVVTRPGQLVRPGRRRKVMSIMDEALSANATIANGYDPSRGGRRRPRSRSSPVRIPG